MIFLSNLIFGVMPPKASSVAGSVDFAFWFITIVSGVAFLLVEGALIYFVIKYRRKKGEPDRKTAYITHSTKLEVIWTVIPTLILFVIFYYGMTAFLELKSVPKNAETLKLTGQMWAWKVDYPICERDQKTGLQECVSIFSAALPQASRYNPQRSPIVVQKGKSYLLEMTSRDVIHSFYVPAFRIKQDVVPGLITRQWFQAIETGEFKVFCAEYCGLNHSGMMATIKVVEPEEFTQWQNEKREKAKAKLASLVKDFSEGSSNNPKIMARLGERTFNNKCVSCHKIDGTRLVGPPLNGIIGKKREFTDGSSLIADEAYLESSIKNPSKQIVKGYAPSMVVQISDSEIPQVIEYLKTIK